MPLAELKRHHPHPAGAARPHPLPHVLLLPRRWGFCMAHDRLHGHAGRPLRGGDRFDARGRQSHLRRIPAPRRDRTTSSCSRPTSAIRRSPTTIARGWRCWPSGEPAQVASQTRYSYRFLFAPGTIGSLAWLAANEARSRPHQARAGGVVRRRRRRPHLQEEPRAAMRRSTAPWRMSCAARPAARTSPTSRPMAMTSGSTARRASTCRSACSSAAPSAPSRNTIPPATISTSSAPSIWPAPTA